METQPAAVNADEVATVRWRRARWFLRVLRIRGAADRRLLTGEELEVADVPHPIGAPPHDLPPQPAVFAPDYAPEEIAQIAQKLRKQAGLPKEPTGQVSDESAEFVDALVGKARS